MNQIRKDLNLITESLQIDDAYQALPLAVREDLKTIFSEISKLNEAALAPEQIQSVFQSMVTNRGEGGNTAQLAKKAQAQLTPLFAKITGNPKLKAILSKVGSAVPIEGLKKMVAKLPDPAGSNAQAVVASIQKGAQSIENDEDVAAFKGLMLTVITIGMGVAGAGGPAMLGIIGTTAIFRTVVDAGIKAAAGGTVADVAKSAGIGLAKGAVAGIIGNAIGDVFSAEVQPPTVEDGIAVVAPVEIDTARLSDAADIDVADTTAVEELLASYPETIEEFQLQSAQQWADSLKDQNNFDIPPAMVQKMADNMEVTGDYPNNFSMSTGSGGFNQGGIYLTPSEQSAYSQFAQGKSLGELVGAEGDEWLSQNVEGAEEFLADRAANAAAEAEALTVRYDAMSPEEQQAFDIDRAEFDELWSDEPYTPPGTPKYDIEAVGGAEAETTAGFDSSMWTQDEKELIELLKAGATEGGDPSQIISDYTDTMTADDPGNYSITATEYEFFVRNTLGIDPLSNQPDELAKVFANESFVHPEWKNVLSEEVGEEFDTLVEQVGEAVAVYAMLEWYNSYVKDTQPIIEGMEYLQKYQLIESVEQTMSEAPDLGGLAKKVGGAYKSAVGKAGAVAKKAGGAVVNTIIKPIINSAPVKAFTNKLTALVGAQGAIDPEKLQADYTAAKSPTDSDAVGKFLQQNAGATKDEVDTAFKAAGVQAVAPEEEPEADAEPAVAQVDANQDGKDDATGAPIPTAQPGDADGAPTSTAQAQVDANQDGKDDATGAPITPTGTSTPGDPKTSAQGNTSSPAGATASGKTPGGAIKQGMDNAEAGNNEIKDGTKKSVNKIPHTWSAEQGEWINAQGVPAIGLMKQELMKQVGKDVTGGNEKPGMMQRAKDYVTGKTPGLAQATRSDPKASILKKAGATAAAGLGGMIGKALGGGQPAPGEPAPAPGEPAPAGQAQPEKTPGQFKQAHVPGGKGETQNDPYEVAKQAIRGEQGKDANKKQLPGGKLPPAAGKKVSDMLGQLANGNKDAGAIAGQQILAYAKQGYDVSNAAQVFLAKAKQGERFLKQESYEYFTQMLESFGLGWGDIGITVRIDESVSEGVWLISSDLLRMKDLAGI
jgi:hypothetical protein